MKLPSGYKDFLLGQFSADLVHRLLDSLETDVSLRHAVFHRQTIESWSLSNPEFLVFHKNHRLCNGAFFARDFVFAHCPGYYTGLYYPQEASASEVVSLLPENLNLVLDLCAAPGGKSIQLSHKLSADGCLISNEIVPKRAKILSQNLERAGILGRVVTSKSPTELSSRFGSIFDAVLVDAPCSGEGMFRKDPQTIGEWSQNQVEICVARQREILKDAAKLVSEGGYLLYSTCTFNWYENEGQIKNFLESHPEFYTEKFLQLWPFEVEGEGHFACLLRKSENGQKPDNKPVKPISSPKIPELPSEVQKYLEARGSIHQGRGGIWFYPKRIQPFKPFSQALSFCHEPGVLVVDSGSKPSFSHSLALVLPEGVWPETLTLGDEQVFQFLRGETLATDLSQGCKQILWRNLPLGFGRQIPGRLQNLIPKGLRTFVPRTNLPARPTVPALSQIQSP